MFQDIDPHQYHNEYRPRPPAPGDYLLAFQDGQLLLDTAGDRRQIPRFERLSQDCPGIGEAAVYLFSIDGSSFFLSRQAVAAAGALRYEDTSVLRELTPAWLAFAGATAMHLARWYDAHRFCGHCGAPVQHLENERALRCPDCGLVEYPKIAPVVIVAITDGDKLVMTRYASAPYRRYALVAGFVEIGETLEAAVRREVLEEVGLRVKNIRYYKSQPWAFSESVLMGFFAEVDGGREIHIDTGELAEGLWMERRDIPREEGSFSLTWDMIEAFRTGAV